MASLLHTDRNGERMLVPTARHRRRGMLLLAVALFQFWVWGTRIVNLLGESEGFSTAFVAVHMVLYVTSIAVGIVLAVLGVRMWREARRAVDDTGSAR